MGMFDTTAKEVASERLCEARKGIKSLQDWLRIMEREIEQSEKDGKSFPIAYCSSMIKKALCIYNEVARCNGAVLVRSTK